MLVSVILIGLLDAASGELRPGGTGGVGRIRVDATNLQVGGMSATEAEIQTTTNPEVGFFGAIGP